MTEKSPAVLLREAADLVQMALDRLDLNAARCPDCGRRIFTNYDHAKVRERLDATPEKLRVSANRLDRADHRSIQHVCICQRNRTS